MCSPSRRRRAWIHLRHVATRRDSKQLTIHTTVEICRHLDRLVETGLFGNSRSAVAERLLSERLLAALKDAQVAGLLVDREAAGDRGADR
jgi:hypothetical protein